MQRLLIVIATLLGLAGAAPAHTDERPNFVVMLCDDLGYGDLGCSGHPTIKTPRLDALAASGIRFTDFYAAAPVCSPSRVGLLTGRHPNRAGVYDWIPPARGPRPDAREQVHMRRAERTLPQLLRAAGYATMLAGKWHCSSRFNDAAQPQPGHFGFDHWLATSNNAAPSHENPANFVRNGEPVGRLEGFSCQLVVDEAVRWLDEKRGDRPFFMYLPFHEPHEPVASPADLVETYRDAARNEDEAQYFANVANIDRAVGRLVDALDERGLRNETLVIFTSDNGPETLNRYRGSHRSYGTPGSLRGMKLHTHEGGLRVAGIMSWPGRIEPGRTCAEPVCGLDLLPTICTLAGIPEPDDRVLDGASIAALLDGKPFVRAKPLVWVYFNALNEARVAMRDGRWKLLARLDGGDVPRFRNITPAAQAVVSAARLTDLELYDMRTDAAETINLAATRRELAATLHERLDARYRELVGSSHVWTPATPAAAAGDAIP